jgi:hypothetical protein
LRDGFVFCAQAVKGFLRQLQAATVLAILEKSFFVLDEDLADSSGARFTGNRFQNASVESRVDFAQIFDVHEDDFLLSFFD